MKHKKEKYFLSCMHVSCAVLGDEVIANKAIIMTVIA
jgi:hypothetical protein